MSILQATPTVLQTTPLHWTSLTQSLSAEQLQQPPAPKAWSALQCLQHLVDTEPMFCARIRAFLAGQDFPAFDPDQQGTVAQSATAPQALAAEFARLRAESLSLLTTLTEADLPRRVRHAELGPVTLNELLHEWAAHDLMHTVQAERALMQPFIQGCGPWQKYFRDHQAQPTTN